MLLKTKNKDYTVEFTFEAAESEAVQLAFDYFSGAYLIKAVKINKPEEEMSDEEKLEAKTSQYEAMMNGVANMPKLAIDFLYYGLIEHHGVHPDGDGSVTCRGDAKRVYKEFCKENPDDERALQFGLFQSLKEQMETDGFFDRIGLSQMMERTMAGETEETSVKTPQDHKKKQNTKPLKSV